MRTKFIRDHDGSIALDLDMPWPPPAGMLVTIGRVEYIVEKVKLDMDTRVLYVVLQFTECPLY